MGKRRDSEAGIELGGSSSRLTPVDVQQQQFRRSFRGYDEQEVDDFLDRVTEELTALLDEKRALQEGRGPAGAPSPDPGQVAEATRAAEDIKRNAREQADGIVGDAQARAAAIVRDAESRAAATTSVASATAAGATGGAAGGTAGLSAFVTREREFLQRLATLVQGHAEGVKEMVQAARRSQSAAVAPPSPESTSVGLAVEQAPPAASDDAAIPEPEGFGPPPEPERPAWQSQGGPVGEAAQSQPEAEAPGDVVLRVPEPEAQREPAREPEVEADAHAEADAEADAAELPSGTDGDPGIRSTEVSDGAPPEGSRPEESPRWSPASPPRLPDLPTPPRDPVRSVGGRPPVEEPVSVPGSASRRGIPDDDEPEGEREATLRELFWGED